MKTMCNSTLALGISFLSAAAMAAGEQPPAEQQTQAASPAAAAPTPDSETVKKHVGYFIGHGVGQQLAQIDPVFSLNDVDENSLLDGIRDGMANKIADGFSQENVSPSIEVFRRLLEQRRAKLAADNLEAGRVYMEEFARQEGVQKTESGVLYLVVEPGTGVKYDKEKHGDAPEASVTYKGTLVNGAVFDETSEPIPLPVDRLVSGFSEVLRMMPVGARWKVVIPSSLAYGEDGPGVIGPNATLIFDLKLEGLQKPDSRPAPVQLTPEMLQQLQQQMQEGEGTSNS